MEKRTFLYLGIIVLFSSSIQASPRRLESSDRIVNMKSMVNVISIDDFDKETDRFLKAKSYVFKREWKKAKDRFEAYLRTYPLGHYRDEALYWMAKSLDKLSKGEKSLEQLLTLKEDAVKSLNLLLRNHGESLWKDDALAFKRELAGQLALLGSEKQQRYLDEVVASQNVNKADMKIAALNSVKDLEPEIAIPLLKKILKIEKDPVIRKKGIILLGWEYPEEALIILNDITKTDPDSSVREEATYLVEQIEMENIPVHLNYFCFGAKMKSSKDHRLVPENTLKVFNLPRSKSKSQKSVQKAIKRFFDNKLTDLKSMAMSFGSSKSRFTRSIPLDASRMPKVDELVRGHILNNINVKINANINKNIATYFKYLNYYNFSLRFVSHRIHGFHVMATREGFKKEYDQISGSVIFRDVESDKEYKISYTVDDMHDKLVAIRKDDEVALMVLQFESEEDDEEMEKKIIYNTQFRDILGCIVHSSRNSWSAGEMSRVNEVMDFGEAKVEIRSENGKWILMGNIISDGKTRRFIARNAELYNPKRKIVAEAASIIVPVDHPEKYEVIGKKNK